jgi:OOP family OmpA-OmpF porin
MLKNCLLASAMALSVYALSESAEAGQRPQGWYVGVEGGMTWVQDSDILSTALPPRTIDADFGRDIALIGEVGYSWDNNWRLAFELGLRDNDVDCLSINSAPCTASVLHSVLSATQMVNVVHDIELNDRTFVSLGFGIGGAYVDADGPGLVEDHDYVFAAQALLQLTQPVTQGVDVVVSYRFTTLDDPEFRHATQGTLAMETDMHTVSLGLRFDLSPDAPAAPEAAPVVASAPPPVAPPPAPKQFIVFFGFNKSNLTQEAHDIVREAAATAMRQGFVTIQVLGHTDTVGSDAYNVALSTRRAENVKKALVAEGIPAAGITASGDGEATLMVQTGDRVMEPRNRRAEINLN